MEHRPRYYMARLILASWLASIGITTTFDYGTVSTRALAEAGLFGQLAPPLLLTMAVIALLDSVWNDILPRRFVLLTSRWRHIFYPLAGITLTIITGTIAVNAGMRPLIINYILPCIWCFILTFLQLFAQPRPPSCAGREL